MKKVKLRRRTILSLTGGGSRGAVQVGMLRALIEHKIIPDIILGSSVGALNGVYIANNYTKEGIDRLESIWIEAEKRDIFKKNTKDIYRGFREGKSFLSNDNLKRTIDEFSPSLIENSEIKVLINTTKLKDGSSLLHDKGDCRKILLASCSLPGIFPPVKINGEDHIDGAVSLLAPLEEEMVKRDKIIVLSGIVTQRDNKDENAIDILKSGYYHMLKSQLNDLKRFRNINIIEVENDNLRVKSRDFNQSRDLIDEGYKAGIKFIKNINNRL